MYRADVTSCLQLGQSLQPFDLDGSSERIAGRRRLFSTLAGLVCFSMSADSPAQADPTTAASLSSGWTGLIKAGFGLRLEVFFLVFGMDAD